jgi:Ku70/Ku80 beta-barrel domain
MIDSNVVCCSTGRSTGFVPLRILSTYEIGKNEFILIEHEELEAIQVESTHTIEIDSFVPREQIDLRYLDSPYYIVPNDKVGQEAFAVIHQGLACLPQRDRFLTRVRRASHVDATGLGPGAAFTGPGADQLGAQPRRGR